MRLIRRLSRRPACHGAKAGAFIRLKPRSKGTIHVYTPHAARCITR